MTKITDPGAYLERRRVEVERALVELFEPGGQAGRAEPAGLGAGTAEPERLREAMRYSVTAGGKRLRPLLTIAAAETLGLPGEKVLPAALALELIHTYSLIHDDLPAMDDSDLRRGRPACHRVYGEALAILAGDALLTLAFELAAGCGYGDEALCGPPDARGAVADSSGFLSRPLKGCPERALALCGELARAAGRRGMVGGQVLDLESEGQSPGAEALEQVACLKTGALLQAAVRCGAIAAGASPAALEALSDYGACLGLAFQITDDLLDVEGDAALMGKGTGADRAQAKATLPDLLGPEAARRRAEELYRRALASLEALEQPAELLRELARRVVFRDR